MRDINLARRQLLWGVLFLTGSVLLLFFFVMPEIRKHQLLRQETTLAQPAPADPFSALPRLKQAAWQQQVAPMLVPDPTHIGVVLSQVQGDPKRAQPAKSFPSHIQKVPVTITVIGSYGAIQRYMAYLMERFPYAPIHQVVLANTETTFKTPDESPALEGIIRMDILVIP